MVVASGVSSTISAGLTIGGLANVAGNLTVGQNVAVGGTLAVNGKAVLTTADLPAPYVPPTPAGWSNTAAAKQSEFIVSPKANVAQPTFVSRNGLIEVPGLHYNLAGNVLTFTSPCIGGETVYAYWNGQ